MGKLGDEVDEFVTELPDIFNEDCGEFVELEEPENKSSKTFLASLVAPARRALENEGVITLEKLANFSEKEILKLHGMGKSSIPKLKDALKEKGLMFKNK